MFKRKVYQQMLEWKEMYHGRYACLLEGARRVGKTTIAEEFARNEYETYIKVDFSNAPQEILDVFDDITNLNMFFLRLQMETNVHLIERKSVIIFDEIQLFPKARQAIKHLVKDGRYDYIETGSLISIKKNVKDILIPSEEHRIQVYPMDYEEFLWAIGSQPDIIRQIYHSHQSLGNSGNRTAMRDFRLYMAIGGMPQAIEAYLESNNIDYVDNIKREIIALYNEDLKKIDPSGRISDIYQSIPSQLALKRKRFTITAATGKQKTSKDEERLFDLIDSKIVLPCFNVLNPSVSLSLTKDINQFKLYLADTGLFTTMLFHDSNYSKKDIYSKLLNDKLNADLGYLFENAAAQIIHSFHRDLYYHTWSKEESTHSYEVDFLLTSQNKIVPIEIKSSYTRNHESIDQFCIKYSQYVGQRYLFSQKDVSSIEQLQLKPIYMLPFVLEDLS